MGKVLRETLKKYWKTILTICCVMATAKIMGYSGMISDIAAALVVVEDRSTRLFLPLVGALGAFVTGSGTSTCVLFSSYRVRQRFLFGLNPSWNGNSKCYGSQHCKDDLCTGIAIGAGAIGAVGSGVRFSRKVFKYFVIYVVIAGIICYVIYMAGIQQINL